MRAVMVSIAVVAVVSVGCSRDGGLPAGEIYRAVAEGVELEVREDRRVEYRSADRRLLGTYSIEDDGRVRVVVGRLESRQVIYFEHDQDIGLIGEDGTIYYKSHHAKGNVEHVRARVETMRILRSVGSAMMGWLTDNFGAAAAGQDVDVWPLRTPEEMREVLVPTYLSELPLQDGWGHDLEFRLDIDDPRAEHVMMVRSPGSDGKFEDSYQSGPFDPDEAHRDIVWADGYYLTWPERR